MATTKDAIQAERAEYAAAFNDEPKRVIGYPVRSKLYPGEDSYFKANPRVAGMAADDGAVVLNPYSTLSQQEKDAVALNEAYRLHMREMGYEPRGKLSDDQAKFFKGTEYEKNPVAAYQSILARILSGDPSANATDEQAMEAEQLKGLVDRRARSMR